MLKTKTIAGVHYIEFDELIDETILDELNIRITNISEKYEHLLDKETVSVIGLNEINFIQTNKTVLLNEYTYDIDFSEFDPNPYLKKILVLSELYCQVLWLMKDNSVQFELAHLIYNSETHKSIHSNFWNSSYSNAIGKIINTKFSKSELQESKEIYKSVLSIILIDNSKVEKNVILTNKISSLSRALIFLRSARTTPDIGTKISLYCSVLESLFSISNSELRHRLSETISFFLSNDFNERIKIYKTIQKAYDIRSSIVHGDGLQKAFLKNNNKLLYEIALETDEILRKCLRKILQNSELIELFTIKKKDEINEYFQSLIFKC